ncbi:MAG TPA: hypothetical protein DCZ01_05615 [Elusimicrobia bacterium]|nr:MAG: hypothetical protein A2X37_11415 [Elusimicrobia bacterium GWA2_66_18]OGR70040.1 MAG: hypothetical protein A2X40_01185 [Elusimicrobia bacterium GWC2_65_9]HAZ07999.1 hypothetical protein [Elusimicrobiota bacterium]
MLSRCPSCGSQTQEDERVCAACGWDFVSHKRIELPAKKPSAAPAADGDLAAILPPSREAPIPVERQKPSGPESESARPEDKVAVDLPSVKAPPEVVAEPEPAQVSADESPLEATPQAKTAGAPSARRYSPVHIAAVAGAAIAVVSLLNVYLLRRSETTLVSNPPMGVSPSGKAPAPDAAPVAPQPVPEPTSRPRVESRPAAAFIAPSRVRILSAVNVPSPAPETAVEPASPPVATATQEDPEDPAPARRAKPTGPTWSFEGMVFDLITARGVFAVKLSLRDPDGNVVGETETGGDGRFKIVVPAGGARGYRLSLAHGDYSDRYIDEGDAMSSLRNATPDERGILMKAAARNLPWVGTPKKIVRRDLAVVPRSHEEP